MKKEDIIQTVKNNKDKLPFIAAILVAVLLIINFFLPYGCAKGAYRERLDEHSDVMYIDEIDMTAGEAKDISLCEYARIYSYAASETSGYAQGEGIIRLVLIILIAVFDLFIVLFCVLKKSVPIIVFSVLSFGASALLSYDLSDSRALPSSDYGCGIAHLFNYLLPILAIGVAVWLIIAKKQDAAAIKE